MIRLIILEQVISYIQERKKEEVIKRQPLLEAGQAQPSQKSNHATAGDTGITEAVSISRQNGCCY